MQVEFDMSDFGRAAKQIGGAADQLPFVMSRLLNTAVFNARRVMTEQTWPGRLQVKNRTFLTTSLRVNTATKGHLEAEIYDRLGRNIIQRHARGGTKLPLKARTLAIPLRGSVRRTSRGVAKPQTPAGIIARTPKRALRITSKGIFVGEGGRLHLRYSFKPSAQQPADVPLYETFADVLGRDMTAGFSHQFALAMLNRR